MVALFINGSEKLNRAKNLGFMIFFVMYTANEQLYRKTGWVLILFISFFIFGRYFFSLMYHRYQNDPDAMKNALWLGLYDEDNVPHWQKGGSVYFRQQP